MTTLLFFVSHSKLSKNIFQPTRKGQQNIIMVNPRVTPQIPDEKNNEINGK